MKKTINPGAYGWRHKHWLKSFYPEDLPVYGSEDWRLSYYSNEFSTVLVPYDYWQSGGIVDCEGWLDEVNENFQFFVECNESMLADISLSKLTDSFKKLQPQLSALVFLENKTHNLLSEAVFGEDLFKPLIDTLEVDVFKLTRTLNSAAYTVWQQDDHLASRFVLVDSDLSDLRLARVMVEDFVNSSENIEQCVPQKTGKPAEEVCGDMTVIVNHPRLQVSDLSKFRTVLEIMGY